MRKNRGMIAALTAALFRAGQSAQSTTKTIEPRPGFSDKTVPVFYPNRGTSPKNF